MGYLYISINTAPLLCVLNERAFKIRFGALFLLFLGKKVEIRVKSLRLNLQLADALYPSEFQALRQIE